MRNPGLMGMAMAAVLLAGAGAQADPQMGGMGGVGPGGRGGAGVGGPGEAAMDTAPHDDKPDIKARKAYAAGMKALNKAKGFAGQAQAESNADKKANLQDKASEAYGRALDQFTEALSNQGDMADAWNGAAYVHLHIGAYGEALDDYNHDLKLRPDDMDAVAGRAEACLQLGRLDEVRIAYMDLFNHARERADQLMRSMQKWVSDRRVDSQGYRPADIEAFQAWIEERLRQAAAP